MLLCSLRKRGVAARESVVRVDPGPGDRRVLLYGKELTLRELYRKVHVCHALAPVASVCS